MHHGYRGAQRHFLHLAQTGHEGHADQTSVKNQLKRVEIGRRIFDANTHGRKEKRRQNHP
jgi:hypothetical protein